ncbi:unnamed protein product, partial [Medioppia subpectinata]
MLAFNEKNRDNSNEKLSKKPSNPFMDSNTNDLIDINEQHFDQQNMNSVLNTKTNNVGNSSFYKDLDSPDEFSTLPRHSIASGATPLAARESDLDSPDEFSTLPRHSIASGATPLAARESVIRAQMTMREEDFTYSQTFTIYIGTWNVNGQNVSAPLGQHWLACDPNPPDMYAIGFQELDLSRETFLFNETPKEEMWLKACREALHPKESYELVQLVRLIGMMLIVFVKKDLRQYITNISSEMVGTGLMGRMGNKGGVAVRFDLHNSSVCFVNSHLAAHVEEYQ